MTAKEVKTTNAWKLAYLQRLRGENTDESYINAYLQAWNLSASEVFWPMKTETLSASQHASPPLLALEPCQRVSMSAFQLFRFFALAVIAHQRSNL
jgi:hypothetical protein